MVVWKWFIIAVTLASVSCGVRAADLLLVGRESAGRTDGPRSNQSEIGNGSSGVDDVQTNALAELIIQTGIWKESSGGDAVQTDILAKLINKTGNANHSEVDIIKDYVSSESHENAVHSVSKNYSVNQLIQQLAKFFSTPHSHLGPVFGRPKLSNNGVNNPSQEPIGSNVRKVKRSDDNVRNPPQIPIGSKDPFQPVKDALHQYAEKLAEQETKRSVPKKEIPLTLADLSKLSDDELRDLSSQYISVEEHAKFFYRAMLEDVMNPFVDRQSRDRLDGFWKWFKSFYVPKNIDHIDVGALADANWFGIRKLRNAFITNPDEEVDEVPSFFERLVAFFSRG